MYLFTDKDVTETVGDNNLKDIIVHKVKLNNQEDSIDGAATHVHPERQKGELL